MKLKLYVTRHGTTEFNVSHTINGQLNSPLTPEGIEGSQLCGNYLKHLQFDRVLVSDLGRTLETLHHIGLDGTREVRLRDRDFSDYNGKPYTQYVKARQAYTKQLLDRSHQNTSNLPTPDSLHYTQTDSLHYTQTDSLHYTQLLREVELPGVERYDHLYKRIHELIHETAGSLSSRSASVLFITHCSPVRACAMVLAPYSRAEFPANLRKCDVPNNSVSEFWITVDDATHRIVNVDLIKFASTKHLHIQL